METPATQLPSEAITVPFRAPISLGNDLTYTEISVREPTAGEWLEVTKFTGREMDIKALVFTGGLPEPVINKIGVRDFIAAHQALDTFLAKASDASDIDATEITIPLSCSVDFDGQTCAAITLAEPTAGQWKAWYDLTGVAADIAAVSIVAGIPEGMVQRFGLRDLNRAAAWIGRFLARKASDSNIDDAEFAMPLRRPISFGDKAYTELLLREPTAAQWKSWDGMSGIASDIAAVASIAEIPIGAAENMGLRDLNQAAEWIGRFFVSAPGAGAPS
ncbi:MAG TPA: phage tail assembly protein [Sphingobium sp.]|uniref:phage tail assembly protein n=1 Tax=Sphingobium sp. TaxID=1912891 RepID=UPI002ED2D8A0